MTVSAETKKARLKNNLGISIASQMILKHYHLHIPQDTN